MIGAPLSDALTERATQSVKAFGVRTVFWNDDGDLVTDVDAEVGHTGEQDAVFATAGFDVIGAVMLRECADDLFSGDWADLLVDKSTVIGDSEFQDIAFDKF